MSSPAIQQALAKRDKRTSQIRLTRLIQPWRQEIVAGYRLGMETSDPDAVPMLQQALKVNYNATSKDVLHFDIREFKQEEESIDQQVLRGIGFGLFGLFNSRSVGVTRSATSTANSWVKRTSDLAQELEWSLAEARMALNTYLRSQTSTLTLTEAQWTVETARRVSVIQVKDPLKNSIEQIAQRFGSGDNNGARRLARKVAKLARLPLSVNEGKIVREIASLRSASVGPLQQGQRLASVRKRAEELNRDSKSWRILGGPKTRDTHTAINGQERGVDEPFDLVSGMALYPGDGSLGAPLVEIINCRCTAIYN
jgi:hypothetical protein